MKTVTIKKEVSLTKEEFEKALKVPYLEFLNLDKRNSARLSAVTPNTYSLRIKTPIMGGIDKTVNITRLDECVIFEFGLNKFEAFFENKIKEYFDQNFASYIKNFDK